MKRIFPAIISILILAIFSTCEKFDISPATKVKTLDATPELISLSVTGKIVELSGIKNDDYGVCYASHADPTVDDNIVSSGKPKVGEFTTRVENLEMGDQIYVRVYCKDGDEYVYGDVKTATLPSVTVTTSVVTNINHRIAVSGGNISLTGTATINQRGVCWSTNQLPTVPVSKASNMKAESNTAKNGVDTNGKAEGKSKSAKQNPLVEGYTSDGSGTGDFTSNIIGLQSSTTFYVRAYAKVGDATIYGDEKTFTTPDPELPSVATGTVTGIGAFSATVSGNVQYDGGAEVITKGFCWSKTANPTIDGNHEEFEGVDGVGGSFSIEIEGLEETETYFVRAYATNSVGTSYGEELSFTTYSEDLFNGLTAFYPFSGNYNDMSGNNNNVVSFTTDLAWANDRFGNSTSAVDFQTRYSFIDIPTFTGSSISVSMWYKFAGTENDWIFLLSSGAGYYHLLLRGSTSEIGSYGDNTFYGSGFYLAIGNWYHLVIVKEGTNSKLYVNNVLVKEQPNVFNNENGPLSLIGNLVVTSPIYGALGIIDDVYIYNIALSEETIAELYGDFHQPPTITTIEATSVTQNSALLGGALESDGGLSVAEQGVVWGTETGPTLESNQDYATAPVAEQEFAITANNLYSGTTYYARAYATNSMGTSYGNVITFTTLPGGATVSTSDITEITQTTAVCGGEVLSDGGADVTSRGVCWKKPYYEDLPTIDDSKTENGTGTGSFTSNLSGLTYATTYNVRAYAINSADTTYGETKTFTTLAQPAEVTTEAITNIGGNTATGGGNVTSNGGATVTARGVVWSTSQNPVLETSEGFTANGTGTGVFTSSLTNLNGSTIYYVRAYATNSAGTSYGDQVSFTTLVTPTATTDEVTAITTTTATSGGNVTATGGSPVTERGVCWSTSEYPNISNSKTVDGGGTGAFTSSITGLTEGTQYFVRAYATSSAGTGYGEQVSFYSLTLPTVTTAEATDVTHNSATCGGEVTADGYTDVTARGVCWSTSQNPTIADSKTEDGAGIGPFTSSITGLEPNTTYYIRAYATNGVGTNYGLEVSLHTEITLPTIETLNITGITITTAKSGGNILHDGGTPIIARGVCWSTSHNPTLENSQSFDGSGIGFFVSSLIGLNEGTTYYVRAYATNEVGIVYGEEFTFNTFSNNIYDGIVAYYPFNRSANDASGNENHGTTVDAILTNDRFGNTDYAYDFEGNNGFVDVVNVLKFSNVDSYSINFWVNLVDISETNFLFSNESLGYFADNRQGIVAYINTNGQLVLQFYRNNGTGYLSWGINTVESVVSTSEWKFLSINKTNDVYGFSIYINGVSKPTQLFEEHPWGIELGIDYLSNQTAYFGQRRNESTQRTHGSIDDIRIYNRPLNETEINTFYHENGWSK